MNTQYYISTTTLDPINGYASINQWYGGFLNVYFAAEFPGNYQVIDTDYISYAVVYSCGNTLANSIRLSEYVWLLSRDPLEEGSSDYNTFISNMETIMDAKIPNFDYST